MARKTTSKKAVVSAPKISAAKKGTVTFLGPESALENRFGLFKKDVETKTSPGAVSYLKKNFSDSFKFN